MDPLPFAALPEDDVELSVVDLGVARAFWEGVATARLLARIRLHRDERDLIDLDQRASGVELTDSSWDVVLARLLGAAPPSLAKMKRAIVRHARAGSDEGPLAGSDRAIAALVHAHLSSTDIDASPAEGAADALPIEEAVRLACARFDERLGRGDRRAASFEACLELARRATTTAWPLGVLRAALGGLEAAPAPLYPWSEDADVAEGDRRVCLLDRPAVERFVLQLGRARTTVPEIARDVGTLLAKHGALLAILLRDDREPRSHREVPRVPPASWIPADLDIHESAGALAAALERGSVTAPRARGVIVRGGDLALDAIGKEMLDVAAHPFASAVFAEILAPFARERDVVRLVTYFAIAPDPVTAAHALSLCNAREVVSTVLEAWLATMLPADGALAEPGNDPDTSASARVASCIAALAPYPDLYDVVRPLLSRLSELPTG